MIKVILLAFCLSGCNISFSTDPKEVVKDVRYTKDISTGQYFVINNISGPDLSSYGNHSSYISTYIPCTDEVEREIIFEESSKKK